jgi:hypothetical protein
VRQYHQWIYRQILTKSPGGMPAFPTKFDRIEGVPEWASLVHEAWMQAREVPRWWIEHRLTPNGEFGGEIGDDTDLYQNFAPFPMLERDGIGGRLLDAAARMAELADKQNLEQGVNQRAMDPLHAYEEGLNHEALVAYWNYGDPIYLERCLVAARSTEALTMLTEKGHRHFRSHTLGSGDVAHPRPPQGEYGAHCLMWHPTLVVAWYSRHPHAMKMLTEWGDGWLEHMRPGEHGIAVKLPEDTTSKSDPLPFTGGWGMTGSVFTFLADLTGDAKYLKPYADHFASTGKVTGVHFAEMLQMGMHQPSREPSDPKTPWNALLYATGDKRPFIEALKKDIEELQRYPHMYTSVECFTDRVFLYAMINPSIAYTGGYTTRNKLNLTYAVSWDGFGTDYAALVTTATKDRLKVLLCNVSDKPISGRARLWRLEPGEYELNFGPDANEDDQADRLERRERITVSKGDEIALTLPARAVQVLEIRQIRQGEVLWSRADLAIAAREISVANGKVTGVVHNIGCAEADVVMSLVDANGKALRTRKFGPLAAPLDLQPRTLAFELDGLPADASGWSIIVDADNAVPEILEGNNRAELAR